MEREIREQPQPLPPPVDVPLIQSEEHACNYLPGRIARSRALLAQRMSPEIYQKFMDAGFRRSGRVIYQPTCRACQACVPIRVPVAQFRPSKSQRRCWRRNRDLVLSIDTSPQPTPEKFDLYTRYVRDWHGKPESEDTPEDFQRFLYDSPVQTIEFSYRDASGQLLAVGICDFCQTSLSSVYFYFDPAESRRGLGTYGALVEIDFAARHEIPHYYLGYWIDGCASMQYKSDFRLNEKLRPDGIWERED